MGYITKGSITWEMVNHIRKLVPENGTILELGSGPATAILAKEFTVYSVEHDKEWLNKYHDNYIYAPVVPHKAVRGYSDSKTWYSADHLRGKLPKNYDLLLIDGPPAYRAGIIKYRELFRKDVPWMMHDLHRANDRKIFYGLIRKLQKPGIIHDTWVINGAYGLIPWTR